MLYIVSTPIGNLSDITLRAIDTLKHCDYILCEDTRRSSHLLNHYGIHTVLKSYHQFSEAAKEEGIVDDLKKNKRISLITDAGTPGISDPGVRIVKRCLKENIQVVPIPGPSAPIAAISASGLETSRFQFIGFLPRKKGELKKTLIEALFYNGTTICYESANRIHAVLTLLSELDSERTLVLARELTKRYEEFLRGSASAILHSLSSRPLKGEITLLIDADQLGKFSKWKNTSPKELSEELKKAFSLTTKEAIKLASELSGIPKRELYQQYHK